MALQGTELLQVLPVQANGQPSATTVQTTTAAIAALSATSSSTNVITTINTVGNGTIPAAAMLGRIVSRTGTQSGAFTDTTDTAANIISLLSASAAIGTSFQFRYINNTSQQATLQGGAGVTLSGLNIVTGGAWIDLLVTYSAANAVTIVGIDGSQLDQNLLSTQYSTAAVTANGTFAAFELTGANYTIFNQSTATPGTITTRTAAQLYGDIPNCYNGLNYLLRVYQSGAGTLTMGAGSNVTITGTAAISTSTWREYQVVVANTTAVTFTNIGSGTA